MALVAVACLWGAKPAAAQSVDYNTLILALQEDATAIGALNTALGSPPAPYDVYAYLNGVRAALGDPPRGPNPFPPPAIIPATNSVTLLTGASGGNVGNLNTVQNALGGPYFYNYFSYLDPYGMPVYPFLVPNPYDDLINFTIAGKGQVALQTLAQAMSGQPGAVNTLTIVLFNNPSGGTWSLFQTLLCSQFGSCAAAQTLINNAAAGNVTAQNQLFNYLGSLLQSNNTSGNFDPMAVTWIQGLGASGASGGCLLDTDSDGVPDCTDPDIDGDGVPNNNDTDINGDGTADNTDTDGDGIPDIVDPTPNGAPPTSGGDPCTRDTDGDGTMDCADTDIDGDGIDNDVDTDIDGDGVNENAGGGGGGGTTPPTNDCDSGASAPLTGSFGTDPCVLAEDRLSMVNDDYWAVGGEQFVDHLNTLWTEQMLPSLKNMTAQWHASVVDQSRQFGSTVDSHNLTKQIKQTQLREVEAKKRVTPNERACVSATPASPLAVTQSISNALTSGFTRDLTSRSGATPDATVLAVQMGATPASATSPAASAESGTSQEKKGRLEIYCKQFNDPEANAGINPCPNPTTAGPWPNGDIDIEGFLFKDTVDLSQPEQYAAAHEIMTNLIEPNIADKLTDDLVDTQSGREYILRREQIKAWRGVAANIVASMISRRTGMPLPQASGGDVPPPPPPTPPPPPPPTPPGPMGASRGTFADFLRTLGAREASGRIGVCNNIGYCGLYQMGRVALIEAGCISSSSGSQSRAPNNYRQPNYNWVGGASCSCGSSMTAFLANQACQTSAVTRYHQKTWGYINSSCRAMACTTQKGVMLTPSGLLAAAHLLGAGGVHCFLGCGSCPGSVRHCRGIPCDGSGTLITEYMNKMGGYDLPFGGAQCGNGMPNSSSATGVPPPPPKPVGQTIREIRERAGVDPADISDKPSYNEIMLAMTKERFMDPDYYARMQNEAGALQQERAAVKAYVTMQLQDIYVLQEQINVLIAARASMKLNEGGAGQQDRSELMPVR
ncbi:MAG TPA: hypothetical protein VEF76_12220 [Patescibacteria group bacterium]|nr:hypothetical protein [Patescibacteria group bacterium]